MENAGNVVQNLSRDGLLGEAIGDAFGVPVEFLRKDEVRAVHLENMEGNNTGITFPSRWGSMIPAGAWSDDTSMTVATMAAVIACRGKIDYRTILESYVMWWDCGKYTALNTAFGLGRAVGDAMGRFKNGTEPLLCGGTGERDNGNGSLMRILPFSLYCIERDLPEAETAAQISQGSAITHRHDISKMSCFMYTEYLRALIKTRDPAAALRAAGQIDYAAYFSAEAVAAHRRLLSPGFSALKDEEINGSGYVVDTLECAIYSLINTNNFEDAVKAAVNTGYDTDTIGAVAGSLAGILYGAAAIPQRWMDRLLKKEALIRTAEQFEEVLKEG